MSVLGIGIDLVEIARLAASIERLGERFLARVFTEAEIAYCAPMRDPLPHYAARFAAKEAVSKAFGTGIGAQAGWLEIEVARNENGAPFIILHGNAEKLAQSMGVSAIQLSLSHSEHYAIANALLSGVPA